MYSLMKMSWKEKITYAEGPQSNLVDFDIFLLISKFELM